MNPAFNYLSKRLTAINEDDQFFFLPFRIPKKFAFYSAKITAYEATIIRRSDLRFE